MVSDRIFIAASWVAALNWAAGTQHCEKARESGSAVAMRPPDHLGIETGWFK
jgi:hypothetical protein